MGDAAMLDKTFEIIMRRMVETGQAPHYTEIAKGAASLNGRRTASRPRALFSGDSGVVVS